MTNESEPTTLHHYVERDGAPLIYFDEAPFLGIYNDTVSVTLTACFAQVGSNREPNQNTAIIAYLRTSIYGAKTLHAALGRALLASMPAEGQKN